VISVAAGVSLATLRRCAGAGPAVVRTMPNTPAAIGRGAVGAVPDAPLTQAHRAFVQTLLQAAGEVFWLENEGLIDAVTAVSGSGPAYFYRFTELLAQTGKDLGLSAEIAASLATLTFTGAAALLEATGKPAAQLRVEVTSPNGVTAAALAEFDRDDRLGALINEAGRAAVKRNREMGA
jgi:pyrroline-5-carboxylate reductase